ncbi:MAG: type II secretion system protein GspM [Anaeromyxobacter sp.]
MERLRKLQADLAAWFAKLNPRERVMVSAAAVAVALFVVWLVSMQIGRGLTAREQRIGDKTQFLAQIGKLADGYHQRKAERAALEARLRAPPVQLLTFVTTKGQALSIDVGDVRPVTTPGDVEGLVEESAEINLAKVELARLARFLQSLEHDQGVVRVRRIRLTTRADDTKLVDATFTVSTYRLKGS